MNWEAEAARKCIYFYASKSPTETSKPNASTFRYIHKHTWILCYKSVHIEHRAVEQMSTILCWDGVFDVNRQRCLVHGAISSNEDDVENAQGSGASESSRVEATKTEWWRMEGISKNMGNGQAFTLSSFIYFISVCFVSFRCWIVRSIPFARTPNPNKRKNAIKEYGLFRSRSRPCERLMCVWARAFESCDALRHISEWCICSEGAESAFTAMHILVCEPVIGLRSGKQFYRIFVLFSSDFNKTENIPYNPRLMTCRVCDFLWIVTLLQQQQGNFDNFFGAKMPLDAVDREVIVCVWITWKHLFIEWTMRTQNESISNWVDSNDALFTTGFMLSSSLKRTCEREREREKTNSFVASRRFELMCVCVFVRLLLTAVPVCAVCGRVYPRTLCILLVSLFCCCAHCAFG